MGPLDAIKTGFVKSFQYSGRATRPEYWWFLSIGLAVPVFWLWISGGAVVNSPPLVRLTGAALFLSPLVALTTRRLCDAGEYTQGIVIPATALIGLMICLYFITALHRWAMSLYAAGADGPVGFTIMIVYFLGMFPLLGLAVRNFVLGLMTGSVLFHKWLPRLQPSFHPRIDEVLQ